MSTNITTKAIVTLGVIAGLGVSILPATSYAAAEDVTVNFGVTSTLSGDMVCATSTTATGAAGTQLSSTCAISGSSNNGMTFQIKDKDSTLNLVSSGNTIAPIAAVESTTGNLTQNGWGYKLSGATGATIATGYDKFNPITASNVTILTAPAGSATATLNFAAKTALSQAVGTYSDVVTVTVTAS